MSKQQFNKKMCHFKGRYDLFFFLMNTLLQIKFDRYRYCFCDTLDNEEKCQFCVISTEFCDFEKDLNDNMIELEYLQNYQSQLYSYLCKLFYIKKELICCFLDKEYSYSVRDLGEFILFFFLK